MLQSACRLKGIIVFVFKLRDSKVLRICEKERNGADVVTGGAIDRGFRDASAAVGSYAHAYKDEELATLAKLPQYSRPGSAQVVEPTPECSTAPAQERPAAHTAPINWSRYWSSKVRPVATSSDKLRQMAKSDSRKCGQRKTRKALSDKAFTGKSGEGGIRTRGRESTPFNDLANRRLQPLGHLSRLL